MFPILLTWLPMYSWLAEVIRWLAISSARVSHPVSLSPSNRIRMSGPYYCLMGILGWTKSLILPPPFLNIHTQAVSFNLKEGRILASVPACMSTCKRLQTEWPQMIAKKTPYWQYYNTEEWYLKGTRNSSPSEKIMRSNLEVQVSKLVFYTQSTCAVISGRLEVQETRKNSWQT